MHRAWRSEPPYCTDEHPVERDPVPVLLLVRGRRCGCARGPRPALRESTAGGSATRGTSSSTGSRTDRATGPSCPGATSCARRFTRWTSVPTAHTLPGAALAHRLDDVFGATAVVGRLHDVPRHLGMDDDADAGMLLAQRLDLLHREARVDRAVPLPQEQLRALRLLRRETAAESRAGSHTCHLIERHAHLVGGVAAQVLIGQEQHPLAALPRPLERRPRALRRRADDAAVLADEGFDRRRRVDVGDRHDASRRPSASSSSQQVSSWSASAMSAIEQPAARSGRITCWCGAQSTSALSAMKCTPQKTMKSASGVRGDLTREAERVADVVGELDHLVALVVMAENEQPRCRASPARPRCGVPSPRRRGRDTARAVADARRAMLFSTSFSTGRND